MFKIYNNEPYQIKTSEKLTKELKKELSEKIKIKIGFLFWYIADKAKEYGLDIDISAYIIESVEIKTADVDNWTDYFKTFRDVKNRIRLLPKSRGVR